ncbi:MAG: hypothetical protein IJP70_04615 [Bacteroidales bacterium]|nr:hypothetical protein [Bacteroidales bacterium]
MKIGDSIRFLDSVGGGKITQINGAYCQVEDEDGFEMTVPVSQCVVVSEEDDARQAGHATPHTAPASQSAMERMQLKSEAENLKEENGKLKDRIHQLEAENERLKLALLKAQWPENKDKKQGKTDPKKLPLELLVQQRPYEVLRGDVIEVDLHIGQLVESTAGMDNAAILKHQLDVFKQTMQNYRHRKGQRIVFIHGKGEGVLRKAIIDELRLRYPTCLWQDASFQQYGFGATQVTIRG